MEMLVRKNNADYSQSNILYSKGLRLCAKINPDSPTRFAHAGVLTYSASAKNAETLDLSGNEVVLHFIPGFFTNVSYGSVGNEIPILEFIDVKSHRALIVSAFVEISAGPVLKASSISFKMITDSGSTTLHFNSANEFFYGYCIERFTFDGDHVTINHDGYVYSRKMLAVAEEPIIDTEETFDYSFKANTIRINGEGGRAVGAIAFIRVSNDGKDVVVAEAVRKEEASNTGAVYDYISKQYLIENCLDFACSISVDSIRLSNSELE